jgi:DNA repair exonuclease SbcCD ATPase subunit
LTKDAISTENTRIETVKASNERIQQSIDSLERKQKLWEEQKETSVENLRKSIDRLSTIDIDVEIAAQKSLVEWTANKKERDNLVSLIAKQTATLDKEQKLLDKLETELTSLADHKCHSCGQDLHDSKHEDMVAAKNKQVEESRTQSYRTPIRVSGIQRSIGACGRIRFMSAGALRQLRAGVKS